MRNASDERADIANELKTALERKQLEILFQPIIDLPHEELAGFEAIIRWQHPRLGLMVQSEFMHIAEENDLAKTNPEKAAELRTLLKKILPYRALLLSILGNKLIVSDLLRYRNEFSLSNGNQQYGVSRK